MHKIDTLKGRLKHVRKVLKMTQKEIAGLVGGKLRSWQDYESGEAVPGSKVVAGLASIGVNTNWLLTGEGSVLTQCQVGEDSATYGYLDRGHTLDAVYKVDKILFSKGVLIEPEKKILLIQYVVDSMDKDGRIDDDELLKIVNLAL